MKKKLLKTAYVITVVYGISKWFLLKNWENNDKVLQGAIRNVK